MVANPTKFDDLPSAQRWLAGRVQALGHEPPRWYLTTLEDAGTELARKAAEAGADLVLAWGGDGTTRAVAEGIGTPILRWASFLEGPAISSPAISRCRSIWLRLSMLPTAGTNGAST